jgi:hypothetical protein
VDSPVSVMNHGVNGETEIDMLARFDRDVFAAKPDLVICQVGSNSLKDRHCLALSDVRFIGQSRSDLDVPLRMLGANKRQHSITLSASPNLHTGARSRTGGA